MDAAAFVTSDKPMNPKNTSKMFPKEMQAYCNKLEQTVEALNLYYRHKIELLKTENKVQKKQIMDLKNQINVIIGRLASREFIVDPDSINYGDLLQKKRVEYANISEEMKKYFEINPYTVKPRAPRKKKGEDPANADDELPLDASAPAIPSVLPPAAAAVAAAAPKRGRPKGSGKKAAAVAPAPVVRDEVPVIPALAVPNSLHSLVANHSYDEVEYEQENELAM